MKLTNAEKAVVEQQKVKEYLLNPAHPDGAGKAQFFMALGFERDRWQILATALRSIAVNSPVAESIESPHGQKHIIIGIMETPSGKAPWVRTVWIFDRGMDIPRFVTAYPYEE